MIWKTPGKVWPGMRERRKSTGMCEAATRDCDHISLEDLHHECDSDCPLLVTGGVCPRSLEGQSSPSNQVGRHSLDETTLRIKVKGVRRQSLSAACTRDVTSAAAGLLSASSPKRRLKPVQSLSIDNVTDYRSQGVLSPGLLSTRSTWSTSDLVESPYHLNDPDAMSNLATSSLSNVSGSLGERMHELVRAFSSRTQRCKERISQPPTPSSTSSYDAKSAVSGLDDPPPPRNIRLGSFIPMGSQTSDAFSDAARDSFVGVGHCRFKLPRCFRKFRFPETMEPHSKLYVGWLFLVMISYMYNVTVIPLRAVFPYQTPENTVYWLGFDYLCDLIYILDMVVFKTRLRFANNGIVETDFLKTKRHYLGKWVFKLDLLSLLPLDLFYLLPSVSISGRSVWLRLPRMLKIQTFWEFYERCDQAAKSSAHAIRIVKTMTYMVYLIHIETCGYYAVSEYEGIGTNRWVYQGQGNAYVRCFYLATKTATSIGNNPKPTNELEYLFMTAYWLSGVFVFALLIGQIRDIVEAAGQVQDSYRKKMDAALSYMQSINIDRDIMDRARRWFLYNWEQSKTIDERSLVAALPRKLQTDLAISVHFNTLSKVQLFQDCERNLLYDLVLKLKPNLFLPGDYICQKGEVGKEMYIVSQGSVEVVGGENNEVVLAKLSEGSVFGEISLLAMSGRGNRRTADVRCAGFTNVFTLSKSDFEEAMTEYPEAQKLLKKRAKKLLKENAKRMEKKQPKVEAEEIIKTPTETPKLIKTVIRVMNPESTLAQHLGSSVKHSAPSKSKGGNHLTVPGPKPKSARTAQRNMAFDIGDEQVPTIRHPQEDEDSDKDDDENSDEEDEVLVVERIEQDLPDLDVNDNDDFADGNVDDDNNDYDGDVFQNCEDLLNDDDLDFNDEGDELKVKGDGEQVKVASDPDDPKPKLGVANGERTGRAILGSGARETEKGMEMDVPRKNKKLRRAGAGDTEVANSSLESQDSGLLSQSTDKTISQQDSKGSLNSLDLALAQQQEQQQVVVSGAGGDRESCGCRGNMEKCEAHSILGRKSSAGANNETTQVHVPMPNHGRVRKVSTVSLPQLPFDEEEHVTSANLANPLMHISDSQVNLKPLADSQENVTRLGESKEKSAQFGHSKETVTGDSNERVTQLRDSRSNLGQVGDSTRKGESEGNSVNAAGAANANGSKLGDPPTKPAKGGNNQVKSNQGKSKLKGDTQAKSKVPGDAQAKSTQIGHNQASVTHLGNAQGNGSSQMSSPGALAQASKMPSVETVDLVKRLERLGGSFSQLNGTASRKSSDESTCQIPPENQITCAVEIHREKTKTPTTMMSMTEHPSSASTPRASPTPNPGQGQGSASNTPRRSPLPYEYGSMRETIV